VDNVKRSWETCVLKAHGNEPVWHKSALAPALGAALKAINLHEAGWPLTHVRVQPVPIMPLSKTL
jgi:hypothetical protein